MALSSQGKPALQVTKSDNVSNGTEMVDGLKNDQFSHLPENEANVLRRQVESPAVAKVTWRTLFRFASQRDLLVIAVSSVCAIAAGAVVPLNTIIMGSLAGAFQDFMNGAPRAELDDRVARQALFFVYLAIGEFLAIYIATVGFKFTGESITRKTREKYLQALMKQNTAYFDKLGPGEIITRITADTNVIQEGISEKIELAISSISMFFTAYIVGFVRYWKLTLILASLTPTFFAIGKILGNRIVKYSKLSAAAHAEGGNLVEETFSSIRTVTGCGIQDNLAQEYNKCLSRAEVFGLRLKCIAGSGPGFTICIFNLGYALATWMGSRYIVAGETTLAAVVTILLVMMLGAFALVKASQHIQAFANAVAAAAGIYATIDRVPHESEQPHEKKLETLDGHIEFKDVKFIYPSRPDVVILNGLSLTVPAGKTLAITGSSGSGKSTIVALIERFYNPVAGQILIDGINIESLSPSWLRQHIGLVSQDPILFSATIEENILHGLRGEELLRQLTDRQSKRAMAEKAAKLANAHEFISLLPQGYESHVGERGSLLSGGQRQRIAIARAVVGNPKILLFDEATSALDSKSEGVVQAALENAARGRTTIVISHRMSTIRNADSIVVMGPGGEILEQGTYDELFANQSAFHQLVESQNMVPDATQPADSHLSDDDKTEENMTNISATLRQPGTIKIQDPEKADATVNNQPLHDLTNHSFWTLIKFTASLNQQEWKAMLLGVVTSIIAGAGEPVQCIILAKSVATLALPTSQYQRLRSDADFWSGMFVMIAFFMLGCFLVMGVAFGYGSERLVHRGRDRAFRSILRQDVKFFDRSENSVGALTSFLSTETTHLAGMSGLALGTIFQLLATLIIGYIVALGIGWKLALVCIATVPVLLLAGFLSFWSLSRFEAYMKDAYRESAAYASEVTSSIRTIASLTLEKEVAQRYHELLIAQERRNLRFNLKSSVFHAAGQSLGFLCMALCFWYGSSLLGDYSISQFYLVFFLVIFGTRSAANMFSLAPNMAKARVAATELKNLFERTPAIDIWNPSGHILENIQGSVEFRNVNFSYHPDTPILHNLSFSINPGQYIAFVGSSGCGKSTIISLLERFYDPTDGGVYIDGRNISTLNLKTYRQHLALVSQEPTLFQGTIRDNILLAVDATTIPEENIIKACKEANIYDFILSLPQGFDTVIGSKGSMLSGGQKQRIAIARALLRDPKILLLDEATSALDSASETVVQAALDAAARGRTTIAVAHRLSTVRNAHVIFVVDGGRIVESGNHEALMAGRGRYFEMVQLQSAEKEKEGGN